MIEFKNLGFNSGGSNEGLLESPKSIIDVGALLDESLAADSLLITFIVLGKYNDS